MKTTRGSCWIFSCYDTDEIIVSPSLNWNDSQFALMTNDILNFNKYTNSKKYPIIHKLISSGHSYILVLDKL